jgi:hypothetical protein
MRAQRVVVVAVLVVGLAACSEDPEENTTQACDAEVQLESALENFDSVVGPDATIDEIRQARAQVADAVDQLTEAADDVAADRADAVDQAWSDLDAAVDDVDGDDTVPEAVDSLRDEASQVATAREDLVTDLDC